MTFQGDKAASKTMCIASVELQEVGRVARHTRFSRRQMPSVRLSLLVFSSVPISLCPKNCKGWTGVVAMVVGVDRGAEEAVGEAVAVLVVGGVEVGLVGAVVEEVLAEAVAEEGEEASGKQESKGMRAR